jgi:hypothetical protein
MGYSEIVNIDDGLESKSDYKEQAAKRVPHVERLLEDFISYYEAKNGVTLSKKENIAEHISHALFCNMLSGY